YETCSITTPERNTNRNPSTCCHLSQLALAVIAFVALGVASAGAQPTLHYSAGFESSEGFRLDLPLVQQPGWTGIGSDGKPQTDGNGIVGDYFVGHGQQAYVGLNRLTGTNDPLNV